MFVVSGLLSAFFGGRLCLGLLVFGSSFAMWGFLVLFDLALFSQSLFAFFFHFFISFFWSVLLCFSAYGFCLVVFALLGAFLA